MEIRYLNENSEGAAPQEKGPGDFLRKSSEILVGLMHFLSNFSISKLGIGYDILLEVNCME